MKTMFFMICCVLLTGSCTTQKKGPGNTEVTKWQDGKKAAVSITYDDGSINQFRKAMPIMDSLNMPGTFFIVTGQIPGSNTGKFIGRPVKEIIKETATIPTNSSNIYERASAAGYLGLRGTLEYHTKAGAQIDAGNPEESYRIMDEFYKKVRNGDFPVVNNGKKTSDPDNQVIWDSLRAYAARGHEFGSHTVTHPYVCALDEPNILYELEQSRDDIHKQLGQKYTFSAEVPYGTENERAMEYAHKVYPALRNRMPETFLKELNRSSTEYPGSFSEEYVQWQRGAVTRTPFSMMESWIDTAAAKQNIWLVLVIHGVDGIGWEALSSDSLGMYFSSIKSRDDELWIATFGDVAKYMRERMNSAVKTKVNNGKITVNLTHTLDKSMYNIPLTLKTYVSPQWNEVQALQNGEKKLIVPQQDAGGSYVLYQALPNAGDVELTGT